MEEYGGGDDGMGDPHTVRVQEPASDLAVEPDRVSEGQRRCFEVGTQTGTAVDIPVPDPGGGPTNVETKSTNGSHDPLQWSRKDGVAALPHARTFPTAEGGVK